MQLHGYTCILNRKLNNININAKQDNFNFCLQLFDSIVYSKIFLNCDLLYYVLCTMKPKLKLTCQRKTSHSIFLRTSFAGLIDTVFYQLYLFIH